MVIDNTNIGLFKTAKRPKVEGVLHFDGSAWPNPGPNCQCGFKLVVGTKIIERSVFIGQGTNNIAEYRGMIEGMTAAIAEGVTELEVYGDSQLVITGMIHGSSKKGKPHLEALKAEARKLAAQFDQIEYIWIPREQNSEADVLSTAGLRQP